jgi:hypothetical protein
MHRSGSTHIAKTICTAKPGIYYPGFMSLGTIGDDPHTLSYEIAQHHQIRLDSLPFVMHSHTLATAGTLKILEASKIDQIVVVVRNVKDVLRSVCVAHNQGEQMPNVHLPYGWKDWGSDAQMMWLVRNLSPWLFSFYITWSQRAPHAIMVNYEKHYKDEKAGNKYIFDYLGIEGAPRIFRFSEEEDGRIKGQKPRWTGEMELELVRIAKSWGPMFSLMKEDGIV